MAIDRAVLTRQIKEANDIVVVVGSYLALQPAGSQYKAVCPFHNDTRPSLQIDPKWQNFRCWACGKKGDVLTFVQEIEKVDFREARELLARRAGINLDGDPGPNQARLRLLDVMKWAQEQFRECLLDSPLAEEARLYLGERKLAGPTVRQFGLGYAPLSGDYLTQQAQRAGIDPQTLVEVGLLWERKEGRGFSDRFRDRVMFPIRDVRAQTVGFGGRILPNSPYAARGPKYYNSADTPLFNKSDLLYGLDLARHAGATEGYLAVVEGYTDVMMAHQYGITNVIAVMGTALTAKHVLQLRRYVPRVVLVYDADEGGQTGVDRSLELFVSQDVELAIASLPPGLDPCDLLSEQGAEPFRKALTSAVDALDFKLNQVLARETDRGIEGTKRVVNAVLGIMALAPDMPGQAGKVKQELILSRIAHRLGLRLETVWARFGELRSARRIETARLSPSSVVSSSEISDTPTTSAGPAPPLERQLLELLLADPKLVPLAAREVQPDDMTHPGLRKLLTGLYQLRAMGEPPEIDGLRALINHPALAAKAMELMEVGQMIAERDRWMQRVLAGFQGRKTDRDKGQLRDQLGSTADHQSAMELLRKLQTQSMVSDS